MKAIKKIDIVNNLITFEDDSQKYADNYIFELRHYFEELENVLKLEEEIDGIDYYNYLKDFLSKIK